MAGSAAASIIRRYGYGFFLNFLFCLWLFFELFFHYIKHLYISAAISIDGRSLAAKFVSQSINLSHFFYSSTIREIHCFTDSIIDMLLESGLHPYMIFWSQIHGCDKDSFPLFWNLFHMLDAA